MENTKDFNIEKIYPYIGRDDFDTHKNKFKNKSGDGSFYGYNQCREYFDDYNKISFPKNNFLLQMIMMFESGDMLFVNS